MRLHPYLRQERRDGTRAGALIDPARRKHVCPIQQDLVVLENVKGVGAGYLHKAPRVGVPRKRERPSALGLACVCRFLWF